MGQGNASTKIGNPKGLPSIKGRVKNPSVLALSLMTLTLTGLRPAAAQNPAPQPTSQPPADQPSTQPANLPPFSVDLKGGGKGRFRSGDNAFELTGPFKILWGDVILQADQAVLEQKTQHGEATGNVILKRGDEEIRGRFFVFDGKKGTFETQDAAAISPPFSVRGQRLFSDNKGLRAENARVALRPDGGGEVQFDAQEARLNNESRRLSLRNARIRLYGARILTLRHLAIPLSFDRGNDVSERGLRLPVTFRSSQISGSAFGLGQTFTLTRGVQATYLVEQTQRQGTQFLGSVNASLLPGQPNPSRRDVPLPGAVDPKVADRSPLWQVLTARPKPVAYDPVLDFADITTIPNLLNDPTDAGHRNLSVSVTEAENREFAGRRQGPLLVSRRPEFGISWSLPLEGPLPVRDNAAARVALRRVRFVALGEVRLGRYTEIRLKEGERRVSDDRRGVRVGASTLPLLVGNNLLLTGNVSYDTTAYGSSGSYRFLETGISAQWVLGRRLGFGGSVIKRTVGGKTPFIFDQIDTQNEAQARAITLLPGGRYTLSGVARYDIMQGRLFDWEIAVGVRGSVLEPRFSYRRLNKQFGFTIGVPGLVGL